MTHRIFPLGDNALVIEFGNEISVETNERVLRLANFLDENPFPGFIEIVPAYSSLAVFYDIWKVRKSYPDFSNAFETVKNFAEEAILDSLNLGIENFRTLEIPVCFDTEFALDLDFVATENKLSTEKVKKIFLGKIYRVFMLGFLPGFSYMGEVDRRIATPRKTSPRLRVTAGSVGIAGSQTGIYSLNSPGGWQIIGRTPLVVFNYQEREPTFFRAGDSIKFYEIDGSEFEQIKNSQF